MVVMARSTTYRPEEDVLAWEAAFSFMMDAVLGVHCCT